MFERMRPSTTRASERNWSRSGPSYTAMVANSTFRIVASAEASASCTRSPSAPETASAASRRRSSTGGPSARDEHVARAAHGADGRRLGRVGLDLAAQPRDADVDRAVERLPLAVARQRQQLVARQHAVGVLDESAQQVEFHAGDRDLGAVRSGELVRAQIQQAAADLDALRR